MIIFHTMPSDDTSKVDPPALIASLDRKLRHLRRRLIKVSDLCKATADDESFFQFEAEFDAYKKDWATYRTVWDELDGIYHSSGTPPPKEWESEYDALYREMHRADAALRKLRAARTVAANKEQAPVAHPDPSDGIKHSTHLPKIQVPKFSGDLDSWTHFRDTFLSLVHDNTSIPPVNKMHYLRDALVGEPATLLAGLTFDAKSYQLAWDELMNQYDNPRVLASRYIRKIVKFKMAYNCDEYTKYSHYLSQVAESIEAFKALALESEADVIMSLLALRALDSHTRKLFELEYSGSEFPTCDDVIKFVRKQMMACKLSNEFQGKSSTSTREKPHSRSSGRGGQAAALLGYKRSRHHSLSSASSDSSASPPSRSSCSSRHSHSSRRSRSSRNSHSGKCFTAQAKEGPPRGHSKTWKRTPTKARAPGSPGKGPCLFCKGQHALPRCFDFSVLSAKERSNRARELKVCFNCLGTGHLLEDCPSKFTCRFCQGKHHSLLHLGDKDKATSPNEENGTSSVCHALNDSAQPADSTLESLLGTACAVLDGSERSLTARLLLDSGSHFTFITSQLAKKLGGSLKPFDGRISGLGGASVDNIRGWLSCRLRSTLDDDINLKVRAIVVDQITSDTPRRTIPSKLTSQLARLQLADPSFGQPGPIDMLVGIDLYPKLIKGAPIETQVHELYLMPTALGNVVMGGYPNESRPLGSSFLAQSDTAILEQLKAFWEIEEPRAADRRHPDDVLCEELFIHAHSRTHDGRYVVRLPLRPTCSAPDENRTLALQRLFSLERKFLRDAQLKEKYREFMEEYIRLGHMSVAVSPSSYIIPHHGVWQVKPQETKLRVVFDASCSAGSKSLNDVLLPGPKLQADLAEILTRFRLYPVALTGDLVKMYRQVLVHPEDRHLQHILWRSDPSQPVVEYELNTVTYGINTSAYQAIRTIRQLLTDEGDDFPAAASILVESIYVDDIVTGANSLEEAVELKNQLVAMFARGGFELSKWASNAPQLAPGSPAQDQLLPQDSHHVKILGLTWSPGDDHFSFAVNEPLLRPTKRVVLSHVARVFDPLGFLAPVIFRVKVLLQDIWREDLDWDDPLTDHLDETWLSVIKEWPSLATVRIPRYILAAHARLQLIGFSDASSKGYAAVVFARVIHAENKIDTFLLKAKTKVAPTKFRSIAQLELCGALLLIRVMSSITIRTHFPNIFFTDSSVVLSWLKSPLHKLKVFEANRVSAILNESTVDQWRFVRSESNPADVASRGCLPVELLENDLWFHGPDWLRNESLPAFEFSLGESPAAADVVLHASQAPHDPPDDSWIRNFSSLQRLLRVAARILRLRHKPEERTSGPISAIEYAHATRACTRLVQRASLPPAIYGAEVPKEFRQLWPFVDELGLVRVGGRIRHADIDYDQKHPMLLPYDHHFTRLVIDDFHVRNFHAGPTLTQSLLRAKFWIPRSLKVIKSRIYKCVHCRILRAKPTTPFMADLPRERLECVRAFNEVGVDYAGPLSIKESNRRKAALGKAYICIFVCMTTKAVHLELVSSLATDAFLAALDRFVARRGLPSTIHSDNGTNFVGASRNIKELYSFLHRHSSEFVKHLSSKGVTWKFIPPRAPNFGGLWEAGVKSVKSLLVNSTGKQPLTFEELATILARIEGLLNSRPLCPLRDDADEFQFLTPGHFLKGDSLSSLPTDPTTTAPFSLTSRWRLVQQHTAYIWSRWNRDYLHQLQRRTKWTKRHPNLQAGDLVIVVEERGPIGVWPVARVEETHPGRDGVVRVVSIRTPSARIFKRPVSSLVPLLVEPEAEASPVNAD